MSVEKISVSICLGSSCFARGSQKNLEIMQAYFAEKQLDDKIDFSGHLCEEVCKQGPTLKIGDKVYYGVTPTNLRAILDDNFKDL
ncbi:MAG: (2Fe-2S) ferredoxin domain-containing protein [Bacteroidales bacterium]|nr:(2Fe-2S) ferredoxin domain-containing protein [Bacteroidales bacterium]